MCRNAYIWFLLQSWFLCILFILDNDAQKFACDRQADPPGVGYYRHPQRCDQFVQCDAFRQPTEHDCPFGQFFDLNALTCVNSQDTNCPNNPCEDETDGATFPMENNCNGYWKCFNSKSYAHCCVEGDSSQPINICTDITCTDVCPQQNNTNNDNLCNLFERDPSDPLQYKLKNPMFSQISFPCPKGVQFSDVTCMCSDPIAHTDNECQPIVYQNADGQFKGVSGEDIFVYDIDIEVSSAGGAYGTQALTFTGNSRVTIPRLANVDFQTSMLIDFYILVTSTSAGLSEEHIISNELMDPSLPSVDIQVLRSTDEMILMIATLKVKDEIPQLIFSVIKSNTTTRVVFAYNGENALLYTDDDVLEDIFSVPISGQVEMRQSPYHLGIDFTGTLMNFSIYSCLTDFAEKLFDNL